MTFFHLLNCVALSYVPYVITYKAAGLSEYSAHWKCVQAGGMYFLVQFVKMLILATFFPETDSDNLDIVGEMLRCSVDVGDLVGLSFIMNQLTVKGPIKFTCVAVGWATAEFVMTRLLPFWTGARGTEFDWIYIRMSLETNILLFQHIAAAALVWLYSRRDLAQRHRYMVIALLAVCIYRSLLIQSLVFTLTLGPWMDLLIQLACTLSVCLLTIPLYGKVGVVTY
ncbi:BOS complex subunit TMEM147-like [Watersipora subatra]|uniref:BOS complex subunit TMEM147-like n=1 Tax=Watersipora subatra TaxID=2589382 RepID=UPI00355B5B89